MTGKAENCRFDELYIDGRGMDVDIYRKESFSADIDMKKYDVGYHRFSASLYSLPEDYNVYYDGIVPTYIYETPPELKLSNFYSEADCFWMWHDDLYIHDKYLYCLLYRKAGTSKWKINEPDETIVDDLKAGTKYEVKVSYCDDPSFEGSKRMFTGLDTGAVSKSVYIKTAKKDPPAVKSIKVKKIQKNKRKMVYISDTRHQPEKETGYGRHIY